MEMISIANTKRGGGGIVIWGKYKYLYLYFLSQKMVPIMNSQYQIWNYATPKCGPIWPVSMTADMAGQEYIFFGKMWNYRPIFFKLILICENEIYQSTSFGTFQQKRIEKFMWMCNSFFPLCGGCITFDLSALNNKFIFYLFIFYFRHIHIYTQTSVIYSCCLNSFLFKVHSCGLIFIP